MENMPSEEIIYDAIVVGAGPAGCSCALFLARANRTVLIADKALFPREKVCGDAVSGKSIGVLRELGLLGEIEKNTHGVINGTKFVSPNGKEVTVPFPKATGMDCAGYTLPRKQTDLALFDAVRHEPHITAMQKFAVEEIIKDDRGRVCGIIGTDGMSSENTPEKKTFHARAIVGTDGSGSVVSRKLGLPSPTPEHTYMAIRGYWRGIKELTDNIELFFIDGVLPGYVWIFPIGGGAANVGLGILLSDMKKRNEHPNRILMNVVNSYPSISRRFAGAVMEGQIGAWTIPNGSFRKQNSGEGWLLSGDAASLVDPFSGEGVGNALVSGKYAAQTIQDAIAATPGSEPLSAESLMPYTKMVDDYLRPEMEQSYKLQQLSRHKFLLNLLIGKAATKPKVRQKIIDMLASDEEKKKVESPWFYLDVLLPW